MTSQNTSTSRGRVLLRAAVAGIAGALGYLVAELLTQHDLSFALIGMLGIFVVVTLFSYVINVRHVPKKP